MRFLRMLLPVAIFLLNIPNRAAAQEDPIPFKQIRLGAEKGEVAAQFQVGKVYADGTGVTRDYVQAYTWLSLSIDGSTDKGSPTSQEAKHLRDSVAKKMTAHQIAEAKRLASEWKASYVKKIGDGPYSVGWGVAAPILLVKPSLPCTNEAGTKNEPAVAFSCTVRKDGTVGRCSLLKGSSYGLESAIDTIETKWRYRPCTFQGKPVDVQITISVLCLPSQK